MIQWLENKLEIHSRSHVRLTRCLCLFCKRSFSMETTTWVWVTFLSENPECFELVSQVWFTWQTVFSIVWIVWLAYPGCYAEWKQLFFPVLGGVVISSHGDTGQYLSSMSPVKFLSNELIASRSGLSECSMRVWSSPAHVVPYTLPASLTPAPLPTSDARLSDRWRNPCTNTPPMRQHQHAAASNSIQHPLGLWLRLSLIRWLTCTGHV